MSEFICVGPNVWGRGPSIEAAKRQARGVGPLGDRWVVFEYPEGTHPYVDGMGWGINFEIPEGMTEEQCHGVQVAAGRRYKAAA